MSTLKTTAANPVSTTWPVEDPTKACHAFADACNATDLEGLVANYEPDAVIVERTGELTRGTAAIRGHIQQLLAMKPAMHILRSESVVNGDLAQNTTWWHCDATAPDGSAVQLECRGAELLRRQPDGSWRIVVDSPFGTG